MEGLPGESEKKLQNLKLTWRTEKCNPIDFSESLKQTVLLTINSYDWTKSEAQPVLYEENWSFYKLPNDAMLP